MGLLIKENRILIVQLIFLLICSLMAYGGKVPLDSLVKQKLKMAEAGSIEALGETISCKSALIEFYSKRNYRTAWNPGTAREVYHAVAKSFEEGLTPSDYYFKILKQFQLKPPASDAIRVDYEILLTDAYLQYTHHLMSGKLNPKNVDSNWYVPRIVKSSVTLLEEALKKGEITKSIERILPKNPDYLRLKEVLSKYRKLDPSNWFPIAGGESIKYGAQSDRLIFIRDRLVFFGDMKYNAVPDPFYYDTLLFEGMKAFQRRYGLEADGVIGTKTIAALNIPVEQLINQIRVNMERWRWVTEKLGDYYLKINIANFELEVIRGGKIIRTHKVIVGRPERSTPVFTAKMEYLVFNPVWTVPPGILRADVFPGARKNLGYFDKMNLEIYDQRGNLINPYTIDWSSSEVWNYSYRQPSGLDNALGALKFMLPNEHIIYLHDTPAKYLFEQTERAYSSGCIRIEYPFSLAEYILNDTTWTMSKMYDLVDTKVTTNVTVKDKPLIHLFYFTSWVAKDGTIHFRKDIYRRDQNVLNALNQASLSCT